MNNNLFVPYYFELFHYLWLKDPINKVIFNYIY